MESFAGVPPGTGPSATETRRPLQVATQAFRRHESLHKLTNYPGILSLHALARLALIYEDRRLLRKCRQHLLPFVRGQRTFKCTFAHYHCGGNATAFLYWRGKLPEASDVLPRYAEELVTTAPRDPEGIFCLPRDPERRKIWIDVAFAVTPFLLFSGLALDENAYVEEGFQQIRKMYAVFRDPENGLLHQCRGFVGPGELSEDHWSRGNGWGLLALTELVNYLPRHGTRRPQAERMFTDLVNACLRCQDQDGMWHQELTDHTSYVETSGTGLILYAIGVGLEKKLLPKEKRENFLAGLQGYLAYITPEGSVSHTCIGCLCPGDGSIAAYKRRAHRVDDPHGFGPAVLAFGQAGRLGIDEIASS